MKNFIKKEIVILPETREVLFEKYKFQKAKNIEMEQFFFETLNGCELINSVHGFKEYCKYKNHVNDAHIFYLKEGKILFHHPKDITKSEEALYVQWESIWKKYNVYFELVKIWTGTEEYLWSITEKYFGHKIRPTPYLYLNTHLFERDLKNKNFND